MSSERGLSRGRGPVKPHGDACYVLDLPPHVNARAGTVFYDSSSAPTERDVTRWLDPDER